MYRDCSQPTRLRKPFALRVQAFTTPTVQSPARHCCAHRKSYACALFRRFGSLGRSYPVCQGGSGLLHACRQPHGSVNLLCPEADPYRRYGVSSATHGRVVAPETHPAQAAIGANVCAHHLGVGGKSSSAINPRAKPSPRLPEVANGAFRNEHRALEGAPTSLPVPAFLDAAMSPPVQIHHSTNIAKPLFRNNLNAPPLTSPINPPGA